MDNNGGNYSKLSKQQRDVLFDYLTADAMLHDAVGNDSVSPQQTFIAAPVQHEIFNYDVHINDHAFIISGQIVVTADYKADALQACLNSIVLRHESLHSIFVEKNDQIMQTIIAPEAIEPPRIKEYIFGEKQTCDEKFQTVLDDLYQPFKLDTLPLFRIASFAVNKQQFGLVIAIHHIIADEWSLRLFAREFLALYAAAINNEQLSLPVLEKHYSQYVYEQQQWLSGDESKQAKAYFCDVLSEDINTSIPVDFPSKPFNNVKQASFGVASCCLPDFVYKELQEFWRDNNISDFSGFLSAFGFILSRHAGTENVCIGIPVSNRLDYQDQYILGVMSDTFPVLLQCNSNISSKQYLKKTQETVVQTMGMAKYSARQIKYDLIEMFGVPYDQLFSIEFRFDEHGEMENYSPVKMELLQHQQYQPRYDITMFVTKAQVGVHIRLFYRSDLYQLDSMSMLLNHFVIALKKIILQQKLLGEINLHANEPIPSIYEVAASISCVQHPSLLKSIQDKAHGFIHAIAISHDNQSITYDQLLTRVAQWQALFKELKVPKGLTIAYIGRSSADFTCYLLAALAYGLVVVPIDKALLVNRKQQYLKQADPHVIMASELSQLSALYNEQEPMYDEACNVFYISLNKPYSEVHTKAGCVYFTSGTSGLPKAILMPEDSIAHYMHWEINEFKLSRRTKVGMISSISYDASLRDMFVPLLAGGQLIIIPNDVKVGSQQVLTWLQNEHIQILHTTPSIVEALVAYCIRSQSLSDLTHLFLAGEVLHIKLVNDVYTKLSDVVQVINLYGPSETVMVKSYFAINSQAVPEKIPIGTGITDTSIVVARENHALCDVGEIGEIYIITAHASLGYLQSGYIDSSIFLTAPEHEKACTVIYPTGDLGYYSHSGQLYFLGRKDRQYKVRGVRVELQEIEHEIQAIDGVQWVHVGVSTLHKVNHLVAFVKPYERTTLSKRQIFKLLHENLPSEFIPHDIQFIAQIPYLPSGKINNLKLLSDFQKITPRKAAVSSHSEAVLIDIFSQLLGQREIDVHLSFFEQGGHSLLVVQLIKSIQEHFGVKLEFSEVYATSSVTGLNAILKHKYVPYEHNVSEQNDGSPVSISQAGMYHYVTYVDSQAFVMRAALIVQGDLKFSILEQAFQFLQKKHEVLRTSFHIKNNFLFSSVADRESIAPILIEQYAMKASVEETFLFLDDQVRRSYKLHVAPLCKVMVFKIAPLHIGMVISMHHLIVDRLSFETLLYELFEVYEKLAEQYEPEQSTLPRTFQHFITYQNSWLQSSIGLQAHSYYKQQLSVYDYFSLSKEKPKGSEAIVVATLERSLSKDLHLQAEHIWRSHQASVFVGYASLFVATLAAISKQSMICIGTPISSKNSIEFEKVAGQFDNNLPLFFTVPRSGSFLDLLTIAKEQVLIATDYCLFPFEKIQEILTIELGSEYSHPYSIGFSLEQNVIETAYTDSLVVEQFFSTKRVLRYQLHLEIEIHAETVALNWAYDQYLFSEQQIRVVADNFISVVKQFVEQPLAKIEIVGHTDYSSLLSSKVPKVPASYNQESLYLLHQTHGSDAYHMPFLLELTGDVDESAIRDTFKNVYDDHLALQTVFEKYDEQIFQVAMPSNSWFTMYDYSLNSEAVREQKLLIIGKQIFEEAFNLENGPLIRVALVKLSSDTWRIYLCLHHIIADDWSIGILFKEVFQKYEHIKTKESKTRFIKPASFFDYSLWQRNYGVSFNSQKKYWLDELKDCPSFSMPALHIHKAAKQSGNVRVTHELSSQLQNEILNFATEYQVKPIVIFLSAFFILLYRITQQEDFCIGIPTLGRTSEKFLGTIGYFINTISIRGKVYFDSTHEAVLRFISNKMQRGIANSDVSVEQIFRELSHNCSASISSMFQVMLAYNTKVEEFPTLKNLSVSSIKIPRKHAKYLMELFILDLSHKCFCTLEFAPSLVTSSAASNLLEYYETILSQLIYKPHSRITDYALVTKEESAFLRDVLNDNQMWLKTQDAVIKRVENSIVKYRDKIAVIDGTREYSYNELELASYSLAHNLLTLISQEHSLQPVFGMYPGEKVIVIVVPRGFQFISSVIAVMRAGYAFCPIEPSYLEQRFDIILEDDFISGIVTTGEFKEIIQNKLSDKRLASIPVIDLDAIGTTSHSDTQLWPENIKDEALAYIIYTSGSTGRPKGVMLEHLGMQNHIQAKISALKLNQQDICVQNISCGFDMSIWQYLAPLCVGASVLVIDDASARDPLALLQTVQDEKATVLELVPSFLLLLNQMMFSAGNDVRYNNLRWLLVAGEQFPNGAAHDWQKFFPDVSIINAYGPTECNDNISHFVIENTFQFQFGSIPIGKPIQNVSFYVLDKNLQLLPYGVVGELYVAGTCLGRGYVNNEQITNDVFISHPLLGRIYKTGDLVRWVDEEVLEFVGRIDSQIKIRGYRIELQEIISVLEKNCLVKRAIVLPHTDEVQGEGLVAYVLPAIGNHVTVNELHHHCKSLLPEYMVPSYFVIMDAFPLTVNNKVDIKSLPAVGSDNKPLDTDFVALETKTEKSLSKLWEELLPTVQIGRNADFFYCGGHSLIAMRLSNRIQKLYAIDFSIRDIFEHTQLSQMALCIDQRQDEKKIGVQENHKNNEIEFMTSGRMPLATNQERLWFLHKLEGSNAYHLYQLLMFTNEFSMAQVKQACRLLVKHHPILRVSFHSSLQGPYMKIHEECEPVFYDLGGYQDMDQLALHLPAFIYQAFDIERPPLWKMGYGTCRSQEYFVVFVWHHIIMDNWAVRIFLRELFSILQGIQTKQTFESTPIDTNFFEYVKQQQIYLASLEYEKDLSYWLKQHEEDYKDVLIPDLIRPKEYSDQGAQLELPIPKDLWSKAVTFSKKSKYPLIELMLSCYVITLFKYTVHGSFGLGLPVSDRNSAEFEECFGYFINTLALSFNHFKHESCQEYLAYIHHVLLEAFKHKRVPFDKLVERIHPTRDFNRNPLFQTFFSFANYHADRHKASISGFQRYSISAQRAMFDVHCKVIEKEHMGLLHLIYKPTLFLEDTMLQLGKHFLTVLSEFLKDPLQHVSEIDVLTNAEISHLHMVGSIQEFSKENIHHPFALIARQCLSDTNKAQVYSQEVILSHKDLLKASLVIASILKNEGIKKGDCVAITNELDAALFCTLLALWQCGASYVFIEPTNPRKRVQVQLNQIEPAFIICDTPELFEGYHFSGMIMNGLDNSKLKEKADMVDEQMLETFLGELHAFSHENLTATAYSCFTSGSSGVPKAVVIDHLALGNFLQSMSDIIKLTENDRFCAVTKVGFDIHILELFVPLLVGADLMLPTVAIKNNPTHMVAFVREHNITAMQATPSYWKLLFESDFSPSGDHFIALCGGEALSKSLAQKFLQEDCILWNMYGPTETTVWSTCCRITHSEQPIGIGSPIANTSIAVLNDHQSFVPYGTLGELYIGGLGLAVGYAGDKQLTDEKFRTIAFHRKPYKFYKTGDLVRFNRQGDLEFHGRIDSQVKYNGQRIELDEINFTLLQHEAVKHVVTEIICDADNQYLVSFIEYWNFKVGQDVAIREMLIQVLPQAIMPSHLIPIETVPLNENNKIDRQVLFALWKEHKKISFKKTLPRTFQEQALALIWSEILGYAPVGIYDDFFESGGASIRSALFVQQARKASFSFSIKDVFVYRTIAKLAPFYDGDKEHASPLDDSALSMSEHLSKDTNKDLSAILLSTPITSAEGFLDFSQKLDAIELPDRFMFDPLLDFKTHTSIDGNELFQWFRQNRLFAALNEFEDSQKARIYAGLEVLYKWPQYIVMNNEGFFSLAHKYEHFRIILPKFRGLWSKTDRGKAFSTLQQYGTTATENIFHTFPAQRSIANTIVPMLAYAIAKAPFEEVAIISALKERSNSMKGFLDEFLAHGDAQQTFLEVFSDLDINGIPGSTFIQLSSQSLEWQIDILERYVQVELNPLLYRVFEDIKSGKMRFAGFDIRLLEPVFEYL